MDLRDVLISQYLAALKMLKGAVIKCPASAWNSQRDADRTWFRAYHTVYHAHKYLHPDFREVTRRKGYDHNHGGRPISQQELLEFIEFVEKEVPGQLRSVDLCALTNFRIASAGITRLEMHIMNIRHIQHHAGELYERLGARKQVRLSWSDAVHRRKP